MRLDFAARSAHLQAPCTDRSRWSFLAGRACRLPVHGQRPGARGAGRRRRAARTPSAAEEAIGARENPRVVAEYGGVYSDPAVEEAVARVVARLVAASDDPSRRYKITILNSPVANAFALPGGYLYVTRGLIALTSESSELAAVLSHEMAHVLLNHALERAKVVEQADIVERVATDVLSDPGRQPVGARRLAR